LVFPRLEEALPEAQGEKALGPEESPLSSEGKELQEKGLNHTRDLLKSDLSHTKEIPNTGQDHTRDVPKTGPGHTQDIPWSCQGRTLSRTNRADSLILRFSDSHDSPDSLIPDSPKEASPNGEAQRPLRAPPPQGREKRTPKTAQLEEALSEVVPPAGEPAVKVHLRKERASSEGPPPAGEPSLDASLLRKEGTLGEGSPPDEEAPLRRPLLQRKKGPLGGASLPPANSSLSEPSLRAERASSEVPPQDEDAPLSGSFLQEEKAPWEEVSPGRVPLRGVSPPPEDSSLSISLLQYKEVSLRIPPLSEVSLSIPPSQPEEVSLEVPPLQEVSLRSPPQSGKAQGTMRSPPHPAVEAYKKAFFYYPRRNLYSLIIEKVGEDEEDLRLWAKACQSWAAHGWNPRNIAGLLEYYEKRGFEERATISRGIPKFSRAARMAIELAEKYEREEEDGGEDLNLLSL